MEFFRLQRIRYFALTGKRRVATRILFRDMQIGAAPKVMLLKTVAIMGWKGLHGCYKRALRGG